MELVLIPWKRVGHQCIFFLNFYFLRFPSVTPFTRVLSYVPECFIQFLQVVQPWMLRCSLRMAWESGNLDPIAGVAAVYLDGWPPQGPVLSGLSLVLKGG